MRKWQTGRRKETGQKLSDCPQNLCGTGCQQPDSQPLPWGQHVGWQTRSEGAQGAAAACSWFRIFEHGPKFLKEQSKWGDGHKNQHRTGVYKKEGRGKKWMRWIWNKCVTMVKRDSRNGRIPNGNVGGTVCAGSQQIPNGSHVCVDDCVLPERHKLHLKECYRGTAQGRIKKKKGGQGQGWVWKQRKRRARLKRQKEKKKLQENKVIKRVTVAFRGLGVSWGLSLIRSWMCRHLEGSCTQRECGHVWCLAKPSAPVLLHQHHKWGPTMSFHTNVLLNRLQL